MIIIIISVNQLIIGMMPLIEWLNNSFAGLCNPGPCRIDLICDKAICISDLISIHFVIVSFINLMHASTCPLLWWWYDNGTACSMFMPWQNLLNSSEIKLPPASGIIFFGKLYSEKIILYARIRLSADRSSIFLMTGNLLW